MRDFSTRNSPKTVEVYRSNYRIFLCWNYEFNDNTPFVNLNKRQLKRFFIFATEELQWGSARYKNMWSSLNTFSEWIENICDDLYPDFRNIIKKIEKAPKNVVREKSVFTKQEIDGLMQKLQNRGRTQHCCLLAMIMASGMRISEVARMTVDNIDFNNTAYDGLFIETKHTIQTKGKGRNGAQKHRYIIVDLFKEHYDAWLVEREKIMKANNAEHNYVFISSNGQPATTSAFRYWMSDWDDLLDNGKHWYPHAGRHFWTTYLSGIGMEKALIQELQGWSSDALVDLYDDNTAKDRQWKGLEKLRQQLEKDGVQ